MSAFRRGRRKPRPGDVVPVQLEDVLDGYPCPYCSATTAPDHGGVWRCLCGWSAVLMTSEGHPGTA